MNDLVNSILSLPVSLRLTILLTIMLLLWLILGRILLKLFSSVPWILKKIFLLIYMLIEIPISSLHRKYGNSFGCIDQGLAFTFKKICSFLGQLLIKMKKPKTILGKQLLVIYLILCAYLLIPLCCNFTEKPFTFWQKSYIEKEKEFIEWMEDKGWFEV